MPNHVPFTVYTIIYIPFIILLNIFMVRWGGTYCGYARTVYMTWEICKWGTSGVMCGGGSRPKGVRILTFKFMTLVKQ